MQIHQWHGPGYRVTRSEDRFFGSPLREMTLFRFTTRHFEVEPHAGEFSLKVVSSGEERYVFGRRIVALRPRQALLVNAGETYASSIRQAAQSLSIFFRPAEAAAACSAARESAEELLETPAGSAPLEVAQVPFSGSAAFRHALGALTAALDIGDQALAEEEACRLLSAALTDVWRMAPPTALAHVRRRATRDELVARVQRARTLIDDALDRNLSLDRLAEEACLSRYHFLRVFSEVVGVTPLAYARAGRLERARRALERGAGSRRAARLAGYHNERAFRRAYRRKFG